MIKKYSISKNTLIIKILAGIVCLALAFCVGMNVGKKVAYRRFKLMMQTVMTNSILNPEHLKTLKNTPINKKIKGVMNAHSELQRRLFKQNNAVEKLATNHPANPVVIKVRGLGFQVSGALDREENRLADLGYLLSHPVKKLTIQSNSKQLVKDEKELIPSKIRTIFRLSSSEALEKKIKNSVAEKTFNLSNIDYLVKRYETDTFISKKQKITFLWGLVKIYKDQTEKVNYLLSALCYLKPFQLADELIGMYNDEKDITVKQSLISLISSCTYFYKKADIKNLTKQDIHNIATLVKFLKTSKVNVY